MAKLIWTQGQTHKVGSDPNHSLEASGQLKLPADQSNVIVGVGGRVSSNNLTTLVLWVAPILDDNTIGKSSPRAFGTEPEHSLEAHGTVGCQEVVVGVGMRVTNNNLTTLALYARRLNATTGLLSAKHTEYRFGSDKDHALEAVWFSDDGQPNADRILVTGVGARVSSSNVTTLVLETGSLTVS